MTTPPSNADCRPRSIAVVKWAERDGIANVLQQELGKLGHNTCSFHHDGPIPDDVDVVLTFAPYGRLTPIWRKQASIPADRRPFFAHWNFESMPDPRLPWAIQGPMATTRAWLDRAVDRNEWRYRPFRYPPFAQANRLFHKFRYLGEYHHAYRNGIIHALFESSVLFADIHRSHGVPATFIPWGTHQDWHADLDLPRDIDVVWMGKRRTRHRGKILDAVMGALDEQGYNIYIADGIVNPLIFDDERTELLNRAKITLNVLPTYYDPGFPFRFHIAAGNRSLVVSTPPLAHAPGYDPGHHYVSSRTETMVQTITDYLRNEPARRRIAENAYDLVTTRMTLTNSVTQLMAHIGALFCAKDVDR